MVCFLRRLDSFFSLSFFPLSLFSFLFTGVFSSLLSIHDTYLFLLPVIYPRDEAYSNFSFALGHLL